MMKRMLAMLLAAVMLLGVMPVLAEGTDTAVLDGLENTEGVGSETPEEISALTVIHNIAEEYASVNFEDTAGNLSWILADMAVYEELFPESENVLTEERKAEGAKMLVAFLETATKPGDLAKGILALSALGYDARKVYTADYQNLNPVEKLTALVDDENSEITNIYNLPYVILALIQGEGYATEEQMVWLVQKALENKALWQTTEDPMYGYVGTDAMTPMILALAPFCETNPDVKAAVNETVENLKAEQREDGLIDGYEGYEPASTGLAICVFSALEVDAGTVTNGGEDLIDGLLSVVNDTQNGFPNEFATEQGFRGLLAWQLLVQGTGKFMYDFSDHTKDELNLSGVNYCPVVFTLTPELAEVVVEGEEAFQKNSFDLPEGTHTYIVSATGYLQTTGTVTVFAEEQEEHILRTIPVTLTKIQGIVGGIPSEFSGGSSGGSGGGAMKPDVMEPDGPTGPETSIQQDSSEVQEGQTPAEMVLNGSTFPDVKESDWYFTAVKYVYENGLFQGTEEGFEPNIPMSRAMLVTVLYRYAAPEDEERENPFADVPEGQWYTEGIKWAAEHGIVSGVSEDTFDLDAAITREQLALILYRYAKLCGYELSDADIAGFEDADEISDYAVDAIRYAVAEGIISGKTNTTLAPKDGATRAEVATMLMRFATTVR